jgi:hypothetical protein
LWACERKWVFSIARRDHLTPLLPSLRYNITRSEVSISYKQVPFYFHPVSGFSQRCHIWLVSLISSSSPSNQIGQFNDSWNVYRQQPPLPASSSQELLIYFRLLHVHCTKPFERGSVIAPSQGFRTADHLITPDVVPDRGAKLYRRSARGGVTYWHANNRGGPFDTRLLARWPLDGWLLDCLVRCRTDAGSEPAMRCLIEHGANVNIKAEVWYKRIFKLGGLVSPAESSWFCAPINYSYVYYKTHIE